MLRVARELEAATGHMLNGTAPGQLGLGIIIDEGDDFLGFGGELMGSIGITYFFD